MKKFIIAVACVLLLAIGADTAFYRLGFYIDLNPGAEVRTRVKTHDTSIYMIKGEEEVPFTIKGVNMGAGEPGKWATDYAIDKETYLQ